MNTDGGQERAGVQPHAHTHGQEGNFDRPQVASRAVGITCRSSYTLSLGVLAAGSPKTFQLIYPLL